MRHLARTHKIALDWLFERYMIDRSAKIKHFPTKGMIADMFTKGTLTAAEFESLCEMCGLGIHVSPQLPSTSNLSVASIPLFLAWAGRSMRKAWFDSRCGSTGRWRNDESGRFVSGGRQGLPPGYAPVPPRPKPKPGVKAKAQPAAGPGPVPSSSSSSSSSWEPHPGAPPHERAAPSPAPAPPDVHTRSRAHVHAVPPPAHVHAPRAHVHAVHTPVRAHVPCESVRIPVHVQGGESVHVLHAVSSSVTFVTGSSPDVPRPPGEGFIHP